MRTKNGHCGEHRTYSAYKGIPLEVVQCSKTGDKLGSGSIGRKVLKKIHTRRSRRFLKNDLRNENV